MTMEDNYIPKEVMEKVKDPEILRRQISEGKTLQEILNYTDENMTEFYKAASRAFEQEEWKAAAEAFLFLTTLNPYVHTYWLGLGMSEQLREEYQGALLAYAMAILTEIKNPLPHYHSARCYLALNEKQSALWSVDLAIECAQEKEGSQTLLEAAKSLKAQIEKQIGS